VTSLGPPTAERLTCADWETLGHLVRLPLLPAGVLGELLGTARPSSASRRLRRLRARSLVQAVTIPARGGQGGRPLALWQLTPPGWELVAPGHATEPSARRRPTNGPPRHLPRMVATYELLGALVTGARADWGRVYLLAWEAPWRRYSLWPGSGVRGLELPAAAILAGSDGEGNCVHPRSRLLLLPDLGWSPVAHHRRTLRHLVALRSAWDDVFPTLVVGTTEAPGRAAAWRELIACVAAQEGEVPLAAHVTSWADVRERRLHLHSNGGSALAPSADRVPAPARHGQAALTRATSARPVPVRAAAGLTFDRHAVLQLVGRHPFLPVEHVAAVLGGRVRDARARLERLVAAGLVRWVGAAADSEPLPLGLARDELAALALCELTRAGLRLLAALLGLSLARAERLHGLAGGGPERPTHTRRPLARALAHTLGADAVFVALHVASRGGRGDGLVRWDNAAASARGRCRPDGYGVCRQGGRDVGFFLEYDRGTEKAAHYAGKWAAYYAYRDSSRAAQDYATFPTILVVTAGSEEPVLRSARAAAVGRAAALRILTTTTGWIAAHPQGMLGPIWRTPDTADRHLWVRGPGIPGNYTPRLVWPTVADARRERGRQSCPTASSGPSDTSRSVPDGATSSHARGGNDDRQP